MSVSRASRDEPRSAPPQGAEVIRPRAFQRDLADSRDDATLVADARDDDSTAEEALFDRHAADVERLTRRLLGRDSEIADVIQDVFLQAFRNLERLRDPSALRPWLRAITVATARKRIRSRARRRWLKFLPHDELPEIETSDPDDEVLAAMKATYRLLDAMGADLRIVFSLRHLEQLELTEIAQACGVSLATVKRRLRKADDLFVARARRDPHLIDWVEGSTRWSSASEDES